MKKGRSLIVTSILLFLVISVIFSAIIGIFISWKVKNEFMDFVSHTAYGVAALTSGEIELTNKAIGFYKDEALDYEKGKIKAIIDSAYASVQMLYDQAVKEEITNEEAINRARHIYHR